MAFSFWEQESFIGTPDICIIGSGIVGVNAAISMKSKSPQLKILVLERGSMPSGASTKNAGFACFGSISELLMDLRSQSEAEVFSLVEKRWKGLKALRESLGDELINYEGLGSHEIFSDKDEELYSLCYDKLGYFNKMLLSITGEKNMFMLADKNIDKFSFNSVKHMILNIGEGQIDTGKMMEALIEKAQSKGIKFLSGIHVKSFHQEKDGIRLSLNDDENIFCQNLLIATNGFAKEFLPAEDIEPARAQVLVTKPVDNLKLRGCFHYDEGFYYFRNIGNRVLLGGGRNLAMTEENTSSPDLNPKIQNRLEELLRTMILPDRDPEIESRWTGIMGLGSSKKPIIKKVQANVWCAVRLGGMGVAIGNIVAAEVAEMILKEL